MAQYLVRLLKPFGPEERKLALFFIKLLLIWLSWKVIIFILGEESVPLHERMFPALSAQWEAWNLQIASFIIERSAALLKLFGYEAYASQRIAWIKDTSGVIMGNYCIGIQLMYYYVLLLLVSPMRIYKKTGGMITGIVVTFLLNIARVAGLCLVALYIPQYMFIAHDHVFNIIVFGTLIGIYYLLTKNAVRPRKTQRDPVDDAPPGP